MSAFHPESVLNVLLKSLVGRTVQPSIPQFLQGCSRFVESPFYLALPEQTLTFFVWCQVIYHFYLYRFRRGKQIQFQIDRPFWFGWQPLMILFGPIVQPHPGRGELGGGLNGNIEDEARRADGALGTKRIVLETPL